MKPLFRPAMAGLSILSLFAAVAVAYAQKPVKRAAPPKAIPFAKLEPTVKAKCVGCHQGEKPAGGVNLSSYDALMKSKYKGKPVVVAKKPALSVLSMAVHGKGVPKMPPGGSLPGAEVKAVDAWIAGGAKK